ncbi:Uncharacterized protein TCM_026019 [Theobroma cacao]|uniref:Cupin type-1 domain-containing protein n=1 Tax=Theobroma cacao TaxID=3641 RepID=A0A061F1F2_THECC|nr:Uncharacterized protein TCM_026019 [Theobroma cacao]
MSNINHCQLNFNCKFNACGAGFPLQLQNCAQVNEVKHRKWELHEVYPENSRKKITLDLKAALFAMEGFKILLPISPFVLAFSVATASDPSPLQDFFVALKDAQNGVFVNGNFCKDPKLVKAEDFFFSGLNIPGNTSNQLGSKVTPVNVEQIPGLGTLAISLAWIDFAHYGKTNAVAFAGLSSQNPGVITIANAVLGSKSSINPDILSKAFQLDKNVVTYLQSRFWWNND